MRFDQSGALGLMERESRLLRPLNIASGAPGRGVGVYETRDGHIVGVISALGRVFMNGLYSDPFEVVGAEIDKLRQNAQVSAIVVDFHAEATSEKMAMGHWCDGRASLVVGTHTHVPTADAHIFSGGTAYMTDIGMCGSYDSVIGMRTKESMQRFITGMRSERFVPVENNPTLSGVYAEIDPQNGKALVVAPVRLGGVLQETMPDDVGTSG